MAEDGKHPALIALNERLPDVILPPEPFRLTHSFIGEGATGPIISAEYDDVECAAKPVRLIAVPKHQDGINSLIAEFAKLSALKHANIVRFVGLCIPPVRRASDRTIWMLTERAEHNLRECLSDGMCSRWSTNQRLLFLRDILSGVEYMHREGVAHLDLKPENILLNIDGDNGNKITPLITDFGLSRFAPSGETVMSVLAGAGTPFYMPREQAVVGEKVTCAADLFSFGLIAVELLTGVHPLVAKFPGDVAQARAFIVNGGKIDVDLRGVEFEAPNEFVDMAECVLVLTTLLNRCLSPTATDRPSPADIYELLDICCGFVRPSEVDQLKATVEYAKKQHARLKSQCGVLPHPSLRPGVIYLEAQNHIYGRDGCVKDVRKGAALLKQAAEMGHTCAMLECADCLRHRVFFVKGDLSQGEQLVINAAEAGDQLAVALCHLDGLGSFKADESKFVDILKSLDASAPLVMHYLGIAYFDGYGVEVDKSVATTWFQRAADAGCVLGQDWLASCYGAGLGVPQDDKRAFELHKLAAAQGSEYAIDRVIKCYEKGMGTEKSKYWATEYRRLLALFGT